MKDLLSNALHIFIILMIAGFVVGGILAVTGTFDHWSSRYVLKRRRQRLMRNRRAELRNTKQQVQNTSPHYETRANRGGDNYNQRPA
ncbi:hypothetical protein DYU05_17970 [Mucilaginibacter terrenus]|uniref:Uncharacterized protein n=1 Tax=Mucilaginibacter terrenus TaxID=2482727 RepID=A0A3E2NL61_9SPHI|nr:hypothetical protein [Mucilaginibacter terrenus]RFZ81711.1 hypothetical protein DYU05_17970 [Mucilaginibacter terrenus]